MTNAEIKLDARLQANKRYSTNSAGTLTQMNSITGGTECAVVLSQEEIDALKTLKEKGLTQPFTKQTFGNACAEHKRAKLRLL